MQNPPKKIIVRPYVLGDIPKLYDAVIESRNELAAWLPWCTPEYSFGDTQAWVVEQTGARAKGSGYAFAIVNERDQLLGECLICRIDPLNKHADLIYWTRTSQLGRGVATNGVRMVVEHVFASTDLFQLEVLVSMENAACRRVAEKAGAAFICTVPNRLCIQGRMHDAAMFIFTRRDAKPGAGANPGAKPAPEPESAGPKTGETGEAQTNR